MTKAERIARAAARAAKRAAKAEEDAAKAAGRAARKAAREAKAAERAAKRAAREEKQQKIERAMQRIAHTPWNPQAGRGEREWPTCECGCTLLVHGETHGGCMGIGCTCTRFKEAK